MLASRVEQETRSGFHHRAQPCFIKSTLDPDQFGIQRLGKRIQSAMIKGDGNPLVADLANETDCIFQRVMR